MEELKFFTNERGGTVTCYHFCTRDWFAKLKQSGKIGLEVGEHNHSPSEGYSRIAPYQNLMKRLNFSSITFYWDSLESVRKYQGNFVIGEGDYLLLSLEIPTRFCVKMDYYNWCDYLFPFVHAKTKEDVLESLHEEFGVAATLEQLLNSCFKLQNDALRQVVTEFCDFSWVTKAEPVSRIMQ